MLKRRDFLRYACITGGSLLLSKFSSFSNFVNAFSEEFREFKLNASITTVNVGTKEPFKAWTYNGQLPGPEIRVKEGETLRVVLKNYLPEETTIHWHGLPVPNNMDGVPNITQSPVQPGQSFVYEFNATPPGTYIYHTHASYQLDQGRK
jgi:FtsP/CotA-like multicopper oxidase with cupredoxin domain